MKGIWIFLAIGVFCIYLCVFLVGNASPFDKEKLKNEFVNEEIETNEEAVEFVYKHVEYAKIIDYINVGNFTVLLASIHIAIATIFAFIHSIIDKLFFKKFYENANYYIALRRGMFLGLIFTSLVIFKLLIGFSLIISISLVLLILLMEYYLSVSSRKTGEAIDKKSSKNEAS